MSRIASIGWRSAWINRLWEDKDALLKQLHTDYPGRH